MRKDRIVLASFVVMATCSAASTAAESISNTLTAQRVVTTAGTEHLESAAAGKPGDVIQYTVEFRNSGNSNAHAMEATLPIPLGVALMPNSITPAAVRASLDGTTFAPLPLTHTVRKADGSVIEEPVPVDQIRYLRWAPTDLPAHASLAMSARVTLEGSSPVAATSH